MNVELVLFVIFAVTAVGGAFALIGARNPVYSAMGLLTTMFSIAAVGTIALAQFGPGGLQSADEQAPDTGESP